MNESLHTVDGRSVLRMERLLAHPVDKVWRAITEPEHLSRWYPFTAVELDLRPGGTIVFDDGAGTTLKAEITELDPPRVFAFSEHAPPSVHRESDDLVRFELRPEDDGCRLIFTHTFDDRYGAASYASGWQVCLDKMIAQLDGRPAPVIEGNFAELHEDYVARFGLDEGVSVPGGVRFERQMTKPIEKVQAALEATGWPIEWELSSGTGHGARLVVVIKDADEEEAAVWRTRLAEFARNLT
ncbi:SRPBCC family protein [Acrocarpospora catenulata]|uniref:SRPBCC family protein n=1 Tax=Acrocarpospora catenulata TaxID=2836182 RepID=UPI001BDA6C89|nr:SRPBCC family protein [Acrocarpospora catenulata]